MSSLVIGPPLASWDQPPTQGRGRNPRAITPELCSPLPRDLGEPYSDGVPLPSCLPEWAACLSVGKERWRLRPTGNNLSQDGRLGFSTFPPKRLVPPACSFSVFVHTLTPFHIFQDLAVYPHPQPSGSARQQGGLFFGRRSGEKTPSGIALPKPPLATKIGAQPPPPATQLTVGGEESSGQQRTPQGSVHAPDAAPHPSPR